VLAVDGRSNNGKTTVAVRIREMVAGAVVTHTDDIAWEHSRFGWADLLIDGILVPVYQGRAVSYRPPPWDEHGREGSITLIIEGDGAGRREVTHLVDTLIWVQADEREAARRSAARAATPPLPTWSTRPLMELRSTSLGIASGSGGDAVGASGLQARACRRRHPSQIVSASSSVGTNKRRLGHLPGHRRRARALDRLLSIP
jgi:hypothetical protein